MFTSVIVLAVVLAQPPAVDLGCKRRGSGPELASRRDGNPQQFRYSTLRGAAPEKAARCFQAEGKEDGFGWASGFVASLTRGG